MARVARSICVVLMSLIFIVSRVSWAEGPEHWVGTWAAAPLSSPNDLVGAGLADETLREIVHVSRGGSMVRVVFTNEFGTDPLSIGKAEIALRKKAAEIQTATAIPLTFEGKASVVIPAGMFAVSDPVALNLLPLSDVAVSLFVPAQAMHSVTLHAEGKQTNYLGKGNQVRAQKMGGGIREITSWRFLKSIEVMAGAQGAAIVTLGDSITDGTESTVDANARWPDELARRLQANPETAGLGVLNEGISGNRLLKEVTGPSALVRFDRDVLSNSGVRYLIVLEGINDIGRTVIPKAPDDPIVAEQLLDGLQEIIDRAHAHGIKVFGATLVPFGGSRYYTLESEAMRQAENAFIRSGKFDGFIDFDKATRDPKKLDWFGAGMGSTDGLHPTDAGYKAMGDAVDLSLFK
jgi:lysophospholipase L1-like esterase